MSSSCFHHLILRLSVLKEQSMASEDDPSIVPLWALTTEASPLTCHLPDVSDGQLHRLPSIWGNGPRAQSVCQQGC